MSFSLLSSILLVSLASTILASPVVQSQPTRPFYIANKCPTSVNLYIGGVHSGVIEKGMSVTKTLPVNSGFFYTDVNTGSPTAEGTSRAGFLGVRLLSLVECIPLTENHSQPDLYYIVKDTTYINAGISIAPHKQAAVSIYI